MGTSERSVRRGRSPSRQTRSGKAEIEALERRLLLSATVAQAQDEWDFGDAPESYLTLLADNGARHAIDPDGPWLGTDGGDTDFPDAEPDGQPHATAQGDDTDTDPANPDPNYDDEDGVGVAGGAYLVLVQAQISDIKVVVNGPGGVLTAWIDWDGDGTWQHPAEQIYNGFLANGVYYLPVTAPVDSAIGRTFGRFRISSQGEPTPEGAADDGEVEDRMVLIQGYDYGDAPDPTYPTLRSSLGAEHSINPGFHLGYGVDADPNGQGDESALGDDTHDTDDEDGVTFTSPMIPGESATLDVRASIPDGLRGYLDAWLDFGADGGWAETGDRIFTSEPLVDGVKSLSFSVPQTAALGPTFARFRLSLYSGFPEVSYQGHGGPGEVEDYQVQIGAVSEHDLGDAPDSSNNYGAGMTAYPVSATPANFPTVYQTGSPPYGPLHVQPLGGAFLGEGVTLENEADTGLDEDAVNNILPPGDSADRDGRDDGVSFPLTLLHCQDNTMDYTVTAVTGGEFYVNVWHDWNRDGDWNDTLECLDASPVPEWSVQNQLVSFLSPGASALTTPPFTAWHNDAATPLWMRITLSEQAWSSAGPAGDREGGEGPADGYALGETEDYYLDEFIQGDYGIHIEKATNGVDADDAPGPLVPRGSTVAWTYQVTNAGNVPLSDVVVVDDNGTPDAADDFHPDPVEDGGYNLGDADQDGLLDPGEVWQYQAEGTAIDGQYANVSRVGGVDPLDEPVTDEDVSHYYGARPQIEVEKATNGADADLATGPLVAQGGAVVWTYQVSNPGNVPLTDVVVIDDNGTPGQAGDDFHPPAESAGGFNIGDADQDGLLDPGEVWQYEADGVAIAGQYGNIATVAATDPLDETVTDDDPSHYFGVVAGIDVEKATNSEDADDPTGPLLPVGILVGWTYQVSNTGNVPLAGVTVVDDHGTPGDTGDDFQPTAVRSGGHNVGDLNGNDRLDVGEVWRYRATGVTIAGQYENIAVAEGTDPLQRAVSDEDPSHYFGAQPAIHVEKATNGDDADSPTGPYIPTGGIVHWTYAVSNAGNVPLGGVAVTDDNGTPGDSGDDFNPAPVLEAGFNVGDLNHDGRLDVDEVWQYQADGVARAGQYANTATATGTDPLQREVVDDDPSHYHGQPIDLGDAPDPTYPTLLAANGARHVIGGPWLGDQDDAPDAEPDGQPDANAFGDDGDTDPLNPGPNHGDEDGVTIPLLIPGEWARITVEVNGGGGVLQAWLDWNGDGVWHVTDEQIYAGYLPADTHTILVQPPLDSVIGRTFARFRISEQGGLGPDGLALSGEVEDHRAYIQDAPEITVTDSWGDPDDADIAFHTPLSVFRPGSSDSPLVRPAYPDAEQYVDVTNTGTAPLTLFEIQIAAPDVTVDGPVLPLVLPPDQTQRFQLMFKPSVPTLKDATVRDFELDAGMVILSDAFHTPWANVALEGHSTYNSDISYSGKVNLDELGLLNVNFGKSVGDPGWDPTADCNGDGTINLGDLGPVNVEFGRERLMPALAQPVAAGQSSAPAQAEQSKVLGPTSPVVADSDAPVDVILAAAAWDADSADGVADAAPAAADEVAGLATDDSPPLVGAASADIRTAEADRRVIRAVDVSPATWARIASARVMDDSLHYRFRFRVALNRLFVERSRRGDR